MELADPRLIDQLVSGCKGKNRQSRRSTGPRMTTKPAPPDERAYQPPLHRSRRCRCGICPTCQDNARWERIFAEKFADPTYYSGPVVRYESPLNTR